MPFGLKNVGAMYQRAMTTLFHDLVYKEIGVYVNDMITRSQTEERNLQDLLNLFQCLRSIVSV